MKNKQWTKVVAGVALGAVLLAGCGKGPEGVVATVNGENITNEAFEEYYKANRTQAIAIYGQDFLKEEGPEGKETMDQVLRENSLKSLEQLEMIRQDAEKHGVKISDEDVNKKYQEAVTQSGGEEAFNKELQNQHITAETFKGFLKNQLLMEAYTKKLYETLTPKGEELKKYFEEHKDDIKEVKASHILVADEAKAKELKKQLDEGADFATLAKENSQDPGSAENGGDLGFFTKDAMVKPFADKAFSMEKGEISDPVKTDYGYHIIKVEDVKDAYEDFADQLPNLAADQAVKDHVAEVEKKAKVKEYIDYKAEIPMTEADEAAQKQFEEQNKASDAQIQPAADAAAPQDASQAADQASNQAAQ